MAAGLGVTGADADWVAKAVEFRASADLAGSGLGMWVSVFGAAETAAEAQLPEIPGPDRPARELAAWCADRLGSGAATAPGLWAIGRAAGELGRVFAQRGWAVVAAMFAAGDLAALMDWDRLVPAVAREVSMRWARSRLDRVIAMPHAELLAVAGGDPPGAALVTEALHGLASAIASGPAGGGPTATSRLHHSLDIAASWLGAPQLGAHLMTATTDGTVELAAAVAAFGGGPWTWEVLAAWRTGDPLAGAKAVARVHGLGGWVAAIDDLQRELVPRLDRLVAEHWEEAARRAIVLSTDPVVVAIAGLAEHAAATAARELGEAVRARWEGAGSDGEPIALRCQRLVGDPREQPGLWRAAIAPLLTALFELDEVAR
jgi:hypothetical protein